MNRLPTEIETQEIIEMGQMVIRKGMALTNCIMSIEQSIRNDPDIPESSKIRLISELVNGLEKVEEIQ